jgi:hypothetical protein
MLRRISRGPRTLTSRRTDLPRGSTGGDFLSADNGSHHRRLRLYSNHPAGVTFGASRTAIFGHVTERCDLTITGGGASGGTLAHTKIDTRPQRLTFLSRPREVRYR